MYRSCIFNYITTFCRKYTLSVLNRQRQRVPRLYEYILTSTLWSVNSQTENLPNNPPFSYFSQKLFIWKLIIKNVPYKFPLMDDDDVTPYYLRHTFATVHSRLRPLFFLILQRLSSPPPISDLLSIKSKVIYVFHVKTGTKKADYRIETR